MFFEKYVELCNDVGRSPNAVAKELRISSGSVTAWKQGRIPYASTLKKIADYFGVTTAYLLGEPEKEKAPPYITDRAEDERLKQMLIYLEENGYIKKPEHEALASLSEEERALIATFRRLEPEQQKTVLTMIQALQGNK